jgi:hypothetical protein
MQEKSAKGGSVMNTMSPAAAGRKGHGMQRRVRALLRQLPPQGGWIGYVIIAGVAFIGLALTGRAVTRPHRIAKS